MAVLLASYLGCALLALRQRPHFRAASAQAPSARPSAVLRARLLYAGSITLGLSLCCSWLAQGVSFGTLFWVLALGATSVAVTFTLTWRPHWLGPVHARDSFGTHDGESDPASPRSGSGQLLDRP